MKVSVLITLAFFYFKGENKMKNIVWIACFIPLGILFFAVGGRRLIEEIIRGYEAYGWWPIIVIGVFVFAIIGAIGLAYNEAKDTEYLDD